MISHTVTKHNWDEMPSEQVSSKLERRLITGESIMLAKVSLTAGCLVPRHQHHNEQLTQIVEGALRFWIGEDEREEIVVRALAGQDRRISPTLALRAPGRSSR
jgi:quercetin dioxygenase-like cupin family protein